MFQSSKATRAALFRVSRLRINLQRRTFVAPTAVLRVADLVQDLYLRELRAYKPSQIKPSDSEGHVQKFSAPQPPKSPGEDDISADLKAYDSQQVEIEGQAAGGEAGVAEDDWFVEEDDEEEAHAAH